jgi:hypothetical protein
MFQFTVAYYSTNLHKMMRHYFLEQMVHNFKSLRSTKIKATNKYSLRSEIRVSDLVKKLY